MRSERWQPFIFMTPFLLLTAIFYILPALLTVVIAFTGLDAGFNFSFVGFSNFIRIFKDPNTLTIISNTLLFVFITVITTVLINLIFAILTTYFIKGEKVGNLFKVIWMIPMITPSVVYSVLWIWLFGASENGLINKLYIAVTHKEAVNWIANYPFTVVIIATLVVNIAFGTIIFSSSIRSIPVEQFKAAGVDGATDFEIIKSIILPNLKWPISFIILWESLGLLTDYVTILLITNGGPGISTEVWSLSSYHRAFIDMKYGYGAAISLVLIIVVMVLIMVTALFMKSDANSKQSRSRK